MAWVPGAVELPLVAARLAAIGRPRRRDRAGGGHPRRHRPLRLRGRGVRGGAPTRARSTPASRSSSASSPPTPWTRRWTGPARATTNKGYEAAVTALEMVRPASRLPCRRRSSGSALGRCCDSSCPRARSRRPRWSCSPHADLAVVRGSEVDYRATIDDPRVDEVRILRPQEIPLYVADGLFDLGITGRDWIEETGADVVSLGDPGLLEGLGQPHPGGPGRGPTTPRSRRWPTCPPGRAGVDRVPRAHPALPREARASRPRSASPTVPPRRRSPTSPTPWWRSPRPAGPWPRRDSGSSSTLLVSSHRAHRQPDGCRRSGQASRHEPAADTPPGDPRGARQGTAQAQRARRASSTTSSPSSRRCKAPTVSELFGGAGYAVETVVPKSDVNVLIPALKDHGATDIIELPLSKIVH